MNKKLKYSLLRHFPGSFGHNYAQKYDVVAGRFEDALRETSELTSLDLGANIGDATRLMASNTKRVIAFEPDPWAFTTLKANVADLGNVVLENTAVGTSNCTIRLFRHPLFDEDPSRYSIATSAFPGKTDVDENVSYQVQQIDFVRHVRDLDEEIGVVKINIEGAEVDLLEAMFDQRDLLGRIRFIFADTHERRIREQYPRVKALRARARELKRPYINLFW